MGPSAAELGKQPRYVETVSKQPEELEDDMGTTDTQTTRKSQIRATSNRIGRTTEQNMHGTPFFKPISANLSPKTK